MRFRGCRDHFLRTGLNILDPYTQKHKYQWKKRVFIKTRSDRIKKDEKMAKNGPLHLTGLHFDKRIKSDKCIKKDKYQWWNRGKIPVQTDIMGHHYRPQEVLIIEVLVYNSK